jgi:uncharacterized protein (TIGR03437 family)
MFKAAVRLYLSGLVLLAFGVTAMAQQYSITTIAGGAPLFAEALKATGVSTGQPARVTADTAGNVYFSSIDSVFKVTPAGVLTVIAGSGHPGFSGDGGPAVKAQLNSPQGLAVDSRGNLYIADSGNNRVRVVASNGVINTFAGNGQTGDSLPATPVSPAQPVYGDGGPPTQANLHSPSGVAVDSSNNVYIADTAHNRICEVLTSFNVIETVAGDTYAGYGGDAGYPTTPAPPYPVPYQAVLAEFRGPEDVFIDSAGNMYIADTGNNLIRKVTTDGNINYIAGAGLLSPPAPVGTIGAYWGDGGPAISAGLYNPVSVTVDSVGNIYEVEPDPSGARVRMISLASWNPTTCVEGNWCINTIAGNRPNGFGGDGGPASGSTLNMATGAAVDSSGNLYIADSRNGRIRKITAVAGTNPAIGTIAGDGVFSYSGDGGQAEYAQLNFPQGVAVGADGSVYFADSDNNVVRKVTSSGVVSTIAGNGTAGYGGDGASGPAAQLNAPVGVAVDAAGNVFIADSGNNRVRKVSASGAISTVAGNGSAGSTGDGGAASSAELNAPFGLTLDASGNLYVTEFTGDRVRKIAAGSGVVSTVAGDGIGGYTGDGGQAVNAEIDCPEAVAVDASGNIYIADSVNNVVRLVNASGLISSVVGTGGSAFSGDFGPATQAQLINPSGLALDSSGNLFITDGSTRVRKVYSDGIIVTIAGNGTRGFSGDGGPATGAQLSGPLGIAVAPGGVVYVADSGNNAIRQLSPLPVSISVASVTNSASNLTGPIAPGEMVTVYGSGLGPATLAQMQVDPVYGRVSSSLAGTSILFNGSPGPMIYAWKTQAAAVVPYEVGGPAVQVLVEAGGQITSPLSVSVAPSSPGLFTVDSSGKGQATAYNQDGSMNGSASPAAPGSAVTLYETGEGQTGPAGIDGVIATSPAPVPVLPVTATVGGLPAQVISYGGAPGMVAGIMQITVQVPASLPAGNAPVVVQVGGFSSQPGVTIAVN